MGDSLINSSPSWAYLLYLTIAGFLGYGLKHGIDYLRYFRNRDSEAHETDARTERARAEVADIQTTSVLRMHDRLDEMLDRYDEVRAERDYYRELSEKQEFELKLNDHQIKKLKGILDAKSRNSKAYWTLKRSIIVTTDYGGSLL